jgi:hypothetical protein
VTDKDAQLADDVATAQPSPIEQVRVLVHDVRSLAQAEIDYAKARLSYSGGIIRRAGLWAFLALFSISGAFIALILGLLVSLASYVGPMAATAIVVITFVIVAWGAALMARRTANDLKFGDGNSDD